MLVTPVVISAGSMTVAHAIIGIRGLEVQARIGTVERVVLRANHRSVGGERDIGSGRLRFWSECCQQWLRYQAELKRRIRDRLRSRIVIEMQCCRWQV